MEETSFKEKMKKSTQMLLVSVPALFYVVLYGHFFLKGATPEKCQFESPLTSADLKSDGTKTHIKPILYVHFHKSGGSTVCSLMNKEMNITDMNGNRANQNWGKFAVYRNCNTGISGPRHDARKYKEMQTCRHLLPYTMDEHDRPFHRNNFVSVEIPFQEEMPCRGFRSFAIMRDPIQRLISHMRVRSFEQDQVIKWIKSKSPISNGRYMSCYPIVNSMVIRQLLGQERFLDTSSVNQSDFFRAKELVDRFDAFVPLEHLSKDNVLFLLNATIPEFYSAFVKNPGFTANADNRHTYQPTEDFLRLIEQENEYDIMLYDYVLNKFHIEQTNQT